MEENTGDNRLSPELAARLEAYADELAKECPDPDCICKKGNTDD